MSLLFLKKLNGITMDMFNTSIFVKPQTPGLTWHHHQDTGRMQLVNGLEHETFKPHTGGMAIWGGSRP